MLKCIYSSWKCLTDNPMPVFVFLNVSVVKCRNCSKSGAIKSEIFHLFFSGPHFKAMNIDTITMTTMKRDIISMYENKVKM